jgi:V8-like Glu-specific endopeptidase
VRRTWAATTLIVILLAVTAAAAQAGPVVHHNKQTADQVVRYWTPARMKNAKPVERVVSPSPKAKPGSGGSSATSVEVPQPYPSAHGKVFFTSNEGINYVCSGTALLSTNESVVWTAGHCVNEGPGDFYTNFLFVPAYRDGAAPYGRFAAPTLLTTSGWQENGEYGVDVGAAVVGTNDSGLSLSDAVAERPIVFNSVRNQSYQLYGYPAARKFNGQRMRVCNTAWLMDDSSTSPFTMGVPCDMTGGSSGGGWITAGGQLASVVSYGYGSLKNVLFGPHLEVEAQNLYNDAKAAAAG